MINDLDFDVLGWILRFLDPEDVRSCILVCKAWKDIITNDNTLRILWSVKKTQSPMVIAIEQGDLEAVQFFYNKDKIESRKEVWVHLAILKGCLDIVKWFYIDCKYKVHSEFIKLVALEWGHLDILKWLYEQKYIDLDIMDEDRDRFVEKGYIDMLNWLDSKSEK